MIEWIDILTMLGIVMASLAIIVSLAIIYNFARKALILAKPIIKKKEQKKDWWEKAGDASKSDINKMSKSQKAKYIRDGKK